MAPAMDRRALDQLLRDVARGTLAPGDAADRLKHFPVDELPEAQATLDTHRAVRTGLPEVVLAEHKTAAQVAAITARLHQHHAVVLVTRLDAPKAEAVLAALGDGDYDPLSRTLVLGKLPRPKGRTVLVISAGTSDAPVAEEAGVTARVAGAKVERLHDVGVAGIHRITRHRKRLAEAGVLVVVAGMEGALPSVVAGLAGRPVIAVPTSVGYGAAFGGLAALLGMLNSCAPGVSVVNIDNGFGAGQLAALIARGLK